MREELEGSARAASQLEVHREEFREFINDLLNVIEELKNDIEKDKEKRNKKLIYKTKEYKSNNHSRSSSRC